MFRRKEDSLFDTTTDPNQSDTESATVISQPTTASQSPSSSSFSTPAQPASRPAADTRPSTPSSNFRPSSSPISGEMTRNRMPEAKSTMSAAQTAVERSAKFGKRVLTVGNDILLKGEIATCDRLVIEGKVDATLNDVHTVEIAESGSFKGSAQIEDAEISGLFEGDLIVRNRLVIYATGKVRGKITYGEIEIQRGGELSGEIKSSATQSTAGGRNPRQPASKEDKAAA